MNNLKDVSVEIPKRRLTVFTGVSGSGKSSVEASGMLKKGDGKAERVNFSRTGGMCPNCEGRGAVTDFDLSALYDESRSLNEGALTIPGYSMDGWQGRILRGCGSSSAPDHNPAATLRRAGVLWVGATEGSGNHRDHDESHQKSGHNVVSVKHPETSL